ncbi:MAG: GyrI-like domain-containing protein [Verrucomicrobiota bacterium]
MTPKIVKLPALTLVGLEAHFIGPMSPDANNQTVIPPLFGQFFARKGELPKALDECTYGACKCAPEDNRSRDDELVYLVSANMKKGAKVPKGMTTWQIPAQTYACFTHRGRIERLGETMNFIFRTWLPKSKYTTTDGASLERYDDRFGDGGDDSQLDVLIPIKPAPKQSKRPKRPKARTVRKVPGNR